MIKLSAHLRGNTKTLFTTTANSEQEIQAKLADAVRWAITSRIALVVLIKRPSGETSSTIIG